MGIENSANGKGRTIWEIVSGQNRKDMTPLELQYHNPLKASVGVSMSFDHDPNLSGINFFLEGINVYNTKPGKKIFHTDYVLRGRTLSAPKPIRLRLRVTPDEDADTGHTYQLFFLYNEMGWDEAFHDNVLGDPEAIIDVNHDDDGNELEKPRRYWRIDDVKQPYKAHLTTMKDADNNGSIEDDELETSKICYWDYHREKTDDETQEKSIEYLFIEMDLGTKYFTFLRGTDIQPFQVSVI